MFVFVDVLLVFCCFLASLALLCSMLRSLFLPFSRCTFFQTRSPITWRHGETQMLRWRPSTRRMPKRGAREHESTREQRKSEHESIVKRKKKKNTHKIKRYKGKDSIEGNIRSKCLGRRNLIQGPDGVGNDIAVPTHQASNASMLG